MRALTFKNFCVRVVHRPGCGARGAAVSVERNVAFFASPGVLGVNSAALSGGHRCLVRKRERKREREREGEGEGERECVCRGVGGMKTCAKGRDYPRPLCG